VVRIEEDGVVGNWCRGGEEVEEERGREGR
jgi:hypothetical protein